MTNRNQSPLVAGIAVAAALAVAAQAGQAPEVTVVPLPHFEGAHAIWGATGQDSRGHIWFGVTTGGLTPNSAHLIEYVPETGIFTDRGDVVGALRRAGRLRPGEAQAKIHSKIVQGPDNFIYFASMDEEGENADGSRLPTWGGHLWRMNLATSRWEHLLATREALIAVGGAGRYVYALGYFGHVLYQYDTRTNRTARIEVGSVDGHISRNFVVDRRSHAFVPRLTPGSTTVALVEFGPDLVERGATPLAREHYLGGDSPTNAHGIVGLQEMADGTFFFTTHAGRLFRIAQPASGGTAAAVTDLGWIHPAGPSYPASLFTSDGQATIGSVARRRRQPWEWVACTVEPLNCHASTLDVPGRDAAFLNRTALYGSATRDAAGGHYVAGIGRDYRPVVLRIAPRGR